MGQYYSLSILFLISFLPAFSQSGTGLGKITDSAFSALPAAPILQDTTPINTIVSFDVDGDGKPDVVSVNGGVYRNIGAAGLPGFEKWVGRLSTMYPADIAYGDLDGDGKEDLAILSGGDDYQHGDFTVNVFKNRSTPGTISFDSAYTIALGALPAVIRMADLDGDGKQDLVIDIAFDSIRVYRNISTSGGFAFEAPVYFQGSGHPIAFDCKDLNGDGKPDLLISDSYFSIHVTVQLNTSTPGHISMDPRIELPAPAQGISDIRIQDVNMDGKPDIVALSDTIIHLYRNIGVGVGLDFELTDQYWLKDSVLKPLGGSFGPIQTAFEDFNKDGKPDLLIKYQLKNAEVFQNISDTGGALAFDSVHHFPMVNHREVRDYSMLDLVTADFDGDSAVDLLGIQRLYPANQYDLLLRLNQVQRGNVSLPLTLVLFEGRKTGALNQLNWRSANESGFDKWEIERSGDGQHFTSIGSVSFAAGKHDYAFTDDAAEGRGWDYRLRMIDLDAKSEYSKIVFIEGESGMGKLHCFPNPANDFVTVQYPAAGGNSFLDVIDVTGKVVRTVRLAQGSIQTTVGLEGLTAGIYHVSWKNAGKVYTVALMIKR